MGDAVCRRTMTATATGGVTTDHPLADQPCGLISVAAETMRDTLRQIRGLEPGTTAPRITPFRTACVNRIGGARPGGTGPNLGPAPAIVGPRVDGCCVSFGKEARHVLAEMGTHYVGSLANCGPVWLHQSFCR